MEQTKSSKARNDKMLPFQQFLKRRCRPALLISSVWWLLPIPARVIPPPNANIRMHATRTTAPRDIPSLGALLSPNSGACFGWASKRGALLADRCWESVRNGSWMLDDAGPDKDDSESLSGDIGGESSGFLNGDDVPRRVALDFGDTMSLRYRP